MRKKQCNVLAISAVAVLSLIVILRSSSTTHVIDSIHSIFRNKPSEYALFATPVTKTRDQSLLITKNINLKRPHYGLTPFLNDSNKCLNSPYLKCKTTAELDQEINSKSKVGAESDTLVVTAILRSNSFLPESVFDFSRCPYRCVFKPRKFLSEATGVVVDAVTATDEQFPEKRDPRQVYILTGLESPVHYGSIVTQDRSKFIDQFNVTSTYRVDSDFPMFYPSLAFNAKPRKTIEDLERLYKSKTRTAVWFVSNCRSASKRMKYVRELQKYIDVDIYGGCGKKGFEDFGKEKEYVTANYKFYLSFENSFCKDYVTEKFFKLFGDGYYVIPIVRGGADYANFLPSGTYINTANFTSPRHLAEYMREVGNNSHLYSKYLAARDMYSIISWDYYQTRRICAFCEATHKKSRGVSFHYSNIKQWLTKNICRLPTDI